MSSVREHLQKAHQMMSEHHEAMAECHKAAMSKAAATSNESLFHDAAATAHLVAAQGHQDLMQECEKVSNGDLNKSDQIRPDGISRVTLDVPAVRMVLRPGQQVVDAKTSIPEQLRKVIGIGAEDQEESTLMR
jgi:hypothetical protein